MALLNVLNTIKSVSSKNECGKQELFTISKSNVNATVTKVIKKLSLDREHAVSNQDLCAGILS